FHRLLGRRADDDALASREPVGLDDNGVFTRLDVLAGRFGMIEDAKLRRWHIGVPHQLLGIRFARLDLRRRLRRTEDAQAMRLESINDPIRERILWANHGEA